jgi:cyanate lyase
MTEELISNATDKLKDEFEIAKIKNHVSWKQLAKEYGTATAQVSRAISGDNSPKSKRIRKWLYVRLNMKEA